MRKVLLFLHAASLTLSRLPCAKTNLSTSPVPDPLPAAHTCNEVQVKAGEHSSAARLGEAFVTAQCTAYLHMCTGVRVHTRV